MPKTLIACSGLLVLLAACATPSPTRAVAEHALAGPGQSACLTDTGTRLTPKDGCAASGRAYTHTDVERTGAMEPGQLLQIDPAVTIVYH